MVNSDINQICKGGLAVSLVFVSRDFNEVALVHLLGCPPESFYRVQTLKCDFTIFYAWGTPQESRKIFFL